MCNVVMLDLAMSGLAELKRMRRLLARRKHATRYLVTFELMTWRLVLRGSVTFAPMMLALTAIELAEYERAIHELRALERSMPEVATFVVMTWELIVRPS